MTKTTTVTTNELGKKEKKALKIIGILFLLGVAKLVYGKVSMALACKRYMPNIRVDSRTCEYAVGKGFSLINPLVPFFIVILILGMVITMLWLLNKGIDKIKEG